MALLVCPDCKKKVSETAKLCPKCGFTLTPEAVKTIKKQDADGQAMAGCFFVLLFLGYGLWKLFSPAHPTPTRETLQQAMDEAQSKADTAKSDCAIARVPQNKTEGIMAQDDAAIAEAKILDGPITRKQEWQIREELAPELNLLPSQVNGWRSVLKGRAETAKAERPQIEAQFKTEKAHADAVCAEVDRANDELYRAQDAFVRQK